MLQPSPPSVTDDSKPTTIFGLMRHAETDWNREKKIQGQTETHLTPAGRDLARAWGVRLYEFEWDRILTSDLIRARETATEINRELQVPLFCDARLREQAWGVWTGTTIRHLRATQPAAVAAQEAAGWDFRPPRGESRREVLSRCQAGLRETAERFPGNRILVVAHAGVIRCLIYHLSERRFLPEEPPLIHPYHLHWLRITVQGRLALQQVNGLAL